MTKKQERKIVACCGTILFMGMVGLLLWLVQLRAYQPEEPDYVEIVMEELETPEPEIPRVKPEPVSSRRDPGSASPAQSQPSNQPTENSAEQVVSEDIPFFSSKVYRPHLVTVPYSFAFSTYRYVVPPMQTKFLP